MEPARRNNLQPHHGQLRRDRQQGSCDEMLPPAPIISTARCLSRVEIGAGGSMGADNPTCSPTTTLSVDLGELVPTLSFCVENLGTQNHSHDTQHMVVFEALCEAEARLVSAERHSVSPGKLAKGEPIGKGGFSVVFRCTRPGSEHEYALKQMHKVPRYGPGAAAQAAMAQHELDAHVELPPHPFVVHHYTAWQDDRSVFLLLELCACSLYDAFFAPGDEYGGGGARLPEDAVKIYVGSVALALRHLHRHGFVFRDLKLENVLLTAEVQRGHVKLADLGASKRIGPRLAARDSGSPTRRTFARIGTDSYMPPEQWSGRGRSASGDLWALGVLTHELLLGEPGPFGHDEGASPSRFELDQTSERASWLELAHDSPVDVAHGSPPSSPRSLRASRWMDGSISSRNSRSSQQKVTDFADAPEASRKAIRAAVHGARKEEGGAAAADFVVGLLQPCEAVRLGGKCFGSLLGHVWYDGFDWVALFEQRIAPPFVPPADCPADISAEIIADGDFADLIPREVDDATQALFASFGPMHTIGSELTDRE